MAVTINLDVDDIRGRRIDLLGVVNSVPLGSAANGQVSTIFTTGGVWYPTGLNTVYVSHIVYQTASGAAPGTGVCIFSIGSGGTADWSKSAIDFGTSFGLASGTISPFTDYATQQPPLYSRGLNFTVKNSCTNPSTDKMTVFAYGWAE